MSTLSVADRQILENHFGMASGYVLNFSDRTFGEFVLESIGLDIHAEKYMASGTSKANKLRTLLNPSPNVDKKNRIKNCRQIATRLLAESPRLGPLKEQAKILLSLA